MAGSRLKTFGSVTLWLSLLTFGVYFLNVLFGGPLGRRPWMSDLAEMLTLFVAVALFVAGTIAREAIDKPPGIGAPTSQEDGRPDETH